MFSDYHSDEKDCIQAENSNRAYSIGVYYEICFIDGFINV